MCVVVIGVLIVVVHMHIYSDMLNVVGDRCADVIDSVDNVGGVVDDVIDDGGVVFVGVCW